MSLTTDGRSRSVPATFTNPLFREDLSFSRKHDFSSNIGFIIIDYLNSREFRDVKITARLMCVT